LHRFSIRSGCLSRRLAALFLATVASVAHSASAQEPAPPLPQPGWRFAITPYLWLAGLHGTIGIGDVTTDVSESAWDLLKSLRFGAMGDLEARYDGWVFGSDVIYVSLRDKHAFSTAAVSGELQLDQKEWIVTPYAGYSFPVGKQTVIDAFLKARYWSLTTDFKGTGSGGRSIERSGNVHWLDALAGGRVQVVPAKYFRLIAAGDVGGGGAKIDWQVLGSVGYEVSHCCTLLGSYRYLDVDRDRGALLFNVHMHGPLLGVVIRF
jgi:hypothetical protein